MNSISGHSQANSTGGIFTPSSFFTARSDFSKNVYRFCLVAFPVIAAAALVSTSFSEKSPTPSQGKVLEKQTQAITLSLVSMLSQYLPHFFQVNIFNRSPKIFPRKTLEELIPFTKESEEKYREMLASPIYKFNQAFNSLVELTAETDCSFDKILTYAFANKSTCDTALIKMYESLQLAIEKGSEIEIVERKILSILKNPNSSKSSLDLLEELLEKTTPAKAVYASRLTNKSIDEMSSLIEQDNRIYENPLTFALLARYHPSKNVQLEAEKLLETLYDQVKPLNGTAEKNFKPIQ